METEVIDYPSKTPPNVKSTFLLKGIDVADFPDEIYIPPPPPSRAFVHTTRAISTSDPNYNGNNTEFPWYWTRLDHPHLNGNRNAIISVTPRGKIIINAEGASANIVHNPNPVGVVYRNNSERWYIYNLDLSAMPNNASFNVVIEERYR